MLLNRKVQQSKRDFINYYLLEEKDDDVDRMGEITWMLDVRNRTDNLILSGLALWKGNYTDAENLLEGCSTVDGNTDHLCEMLHSVITEKSNSDVCFTLHALQPFKLLPLAKVNVATHRPGHCWPNTLMKNIRKTLAPILVYHAT